MIRGGDNLRTGWVSAGLGSGFAGKPGPGSLCLFVFCFITSSAPVLAKLSTLDNCLDLVLVNDRIKFRARDFIWIILVRAGRVVAVPMSGG